MRILQFFNNFSTLFFCSRSCIRYRENHPDLIKIVFFYKFTIFYLFRKNQSPRFHFNPFFKYLINSDGY
ncbi:MAG: hypothetical protein DRH26_17290, partial [Deltaproteobacteria bacterium]